MNSRLGTKAWMFTLTITVCSLAATIYAAKLSLTLANEQENLRRSSIKALVRDATTQEISNFEDLVYTSVSRPDTNQATQELLQKVDWIAQIDQSLLEQNTLTVTDRRSFVKGSRAPLQLDQFTNSILFESSNKLRSRLIYAKPLRLVKQGDIIAAGLTFRNEQVRHHYVIYLDLQKLFFKVSKGLEEVATIAPDYSQTSDLTSKEVVTNIPTLDVPVIINLQQRNSAGSDLQALAKTIFSNGNFLIVILFVLVIWSLVLLTIREHYFRLKAQKNAFDIMSESERTASLAVLGELATSIAHEINQPLAVIQMRTGMVLDNSKYGALNDDLTENLNVIKKQVRRCSEIVRSVQTLNAKNEPSTELIKLYDFFQDIGPILELQSDKYKTTLDLICPKNLFVKFNKTALEQIALNLTRNGFEAMSHLPETKRILTVKARHSRSSSMPSTMIDFIDQGVGLTKAHQARVFDASYSTKHSGLGLGLALSKTLAEQNNANIIIDSTDGSGSCFQLKINTTTDPKVTPSEDTSRI